MDLNQALFLDRDGTIIKDCEGALTEDSIEFIYGLKDFLLAALEKKYKIIMVTNQTAVSKGLISYLDMVEINNLLLKKIDNLIGVRKVFDEVFICPYHPDAQIKKYKIDSEDRKPKAGMLIKAEKKMHLNLSKCIMVGDRVSDVVAGNIVGCTTIMLKGNPNSENMIKTNLDYSQKMLIPNYNVAQLTEIIPIMENLF